jgi:mono/diheme cytochrome c family protein
LWGENCLPCHGPIGQGDGPTAEALPNPPANLTDIETARQRTPATTFDVIKNGRMENFMPPWGNRLSDDQIWDLVAHIWNLGVTAQDLAAGEAIYNAQCTACHGADGSGSGPEAPARINDFTDLQVMSQQSQADLLAHYLAGEPHAQLSELSQEEIWQALDYIRTFTFIVPKRNGVLSGQVLNGTTNEPQGNIELTLRVFDGNTEVETRTAQADDSGHYTFENLTTDHSTLYVVEGRYQDVTYLSDEPGLFVPDSSETSVDLKVYEPTNRLETIDISQLHYLISFSPGELNVVQVFILGNGDNRTYIGQEGQTFAFELPETAQDVTFQNDPSGLRFLETDTGYADTDPIKPGDEGATIVASYNLPFDDDTLTIAVPIPADVVSLNVLMQDQGATLSGPQIQFVETRQAQGDTFSIYNGGNMSRDQTLTLDLTGLDELEFLAPPDAVPAASAPGGLVNQSHLRWVIIGVIGLAVVVTGLVYPQLRPQLSHQATAFDDNPATRRQKLLLLLARLDQVFQAGELDKAVYRRARNRYKSELADNR